MASDPRPHSIVNTKPVGDWGIGASDPLQAAKGIPAGRNTGDLLLWFAKRSSAPKSGRFSDTSLPIEAVPAFRPCGAPLSENTSGRPLVRFWTSGVTARVMRPSRNDDAALRVGRKRLADRCDRMSWKDSWRRVFLS